MLAQPVLQTGRSRGFLHPSGDEGIYSKFSEQSLGVEAEYHLWLCRSSHALRDAGTAVRVAPEGWALGRDTPVRSTPGNLCH